METLTFVLGAEFTHRITWVAVQAAARILSGVVFRASTALSIIFVFDGLAVLARTDSNALGHPSLKELEEAIERNQKLKC